MPVQSDQSFLPFGTFLGGDPAERSGTKNAARGGIFRGARTASANQVAQILLDQLLQLLDIDFWRLNLGFVVAVGDLDS